MQYKEGSIVIIPSSIKQKILLSIDKLINIKIYTIDEFIKKYYYDYDERSIYYVSKEYNIKPEIAKIYIENTYFIKEIDNEKIKFLNELKEKLLENNLLITNKLFKESLKGKVVEFINVPNTLYNEELIKDLKNICTVNIIKEDSKNYTHTYRHFTTLEDEVVFVASKICELIKSGIEINNIFITNPSEEHRTCIEKIFSLFNIPYYLKNTNTIFSTPLITKFLDNYDSDIAKSLSAITADVKSKEDEYIYNSLINIINKYTFVEDYNEVKEMIINDLKNTKSYRPSKTNCVKEVSFLDYPFAENDYVFLMHFNQGIMPKIHKDENYLSDKIMQELNLDTAPSKNKLEHDMTISKLGNVKNLFISYIDSSLSNSFYPSSIIEELNLEEDTSSYKEFNYSNVYNKIKLASYTDTFKKYNEINKNLPVLNNTYTLSKYNNEYTKINSDNLKKYLNNNLYLSYTSLNNYYKCAFRYYLNNILKLNIYEDTFMQIVGDIFHEVLEKYFQKEKSFDELYTQAINNMNYEYSIKERFFLKKLKNELKFVIDTIEDQNNYSKLDKELFEKKVVTNIEGNINIEFSGKIDKLKYLETEEETIVAIIDYKTGNPELNIGNIIYGLDMQLPVYIYLAKNHFKDKKIKVAGFYLQKILNNEIVADNKHSYETLKRDKLKLQGYSNSDVHILEQFDSTYVNSRVIKSLSVTDKGFGHYSKVISDDKMDEVVNLVEKNIKDASTNILDAEFTINPKAINNKNVGCEYCSFSTICFMKEKDIVALEQQKDSDFLGGEDNANMD